MSKAIAHVTLAAAYSQTQSQMKRRRIIAGLSLLAATALVIISLFEVAASPDGDLASSNQTTSRDPSTLDSGPPKPSEVASRPQAPPTSGLTLHPYDLLKNPYQSRGKLIALSLNSLPVLYNGAVIQYSGPMDPTMGARLGLMALRLERMADENVALYNIMGIEAGSSEGQALGQMAVRLPDGVAELKFDREWLVEPLEPMKSTNYLGVEIQVPSVRFWRYVGERAEAPENENAAIAATKGFRYVRYPHGYKVDELCSAPQEIGTDKFCYPVNWQPWIKQAELETAREQADALRVDAEAASPGNLVVSWDSEQRVAFYGFRPHDSTSASAYFIVAPTNREMDIVWQRGDEITYLGPDAKLLKSVHAYEWLKQIGF